MSDILGFDIDGRPLRAGDEVVIAQAMVKENMGRKVKIVAQRGKVEGYAGNNRLEVSASLVTIMGNPCNHVIDEWLRKIKTDHLPAPQTYEQLIQSLKTGETA